MRLFLLGLICLPLFPKAQTISQKADQLLTAYADQHKFAGTVLIAKEGHIIFEKGYGYADMQSKRTNTPQTEFRVGSLTKMFTSTLILELVRDSMLSPGDPVSMYVPGFPYGDKVKIFNLLSHTSGIRGNTGNSKPTNLNESVTRFKYDTLAFEPGTRFEYNNFNYILLSYIAQKITGTPYPDLIRTRVLQKAGMNYSGLDTWQRKSDEKAIGYITRPETAEWVEVPDSNVALATGAGALYSTVEDLFKWSQVVSSNSVLPDSVFSAAMKPFKNNYGMGWMTTDAFGHRQIGHTGSIPGFIANFMKFPDEDVTIIMLSNYQDVDGRQISKDLAAVVFDAPYSLPVLKKAIVLPHDALIKLAGEYKLDNGFGITVTVEGEKIYAQAQGDPTKIELTPESELKFFLRGPQTEIRFIEEGSEVKYMFVDLQGGQKFRKVN